MLDAAGCHPKAIIYWYAVNQIPKTTRKLVASASASHPHGGIPMVQGTLSRSPPALSCTIKPEGIRRAGDFEDHKQESTALKHTGERVALQVVAGIVAGAAGASPAE